MTLSSTSQSASDPTRETAVYLQAHELVKRYEDDAIAVDNVSFSVEKGEIYAMLGGNGAGKSTTINCFLDLIQPTSGEVRVGGASVQADPVAAKSQLAYVSENVQLYGELSAQQNMEFFARLGGLQPSRDEIYACLDRVGLAEEYYRRRVKTFSKGMRQKTGLAIAILRDAPAMLLDEPTSGLDPRAAWELSNLLCDLRDQGKAILMSTHDIFRAKQIADRIGIMNRGSLVLERDRLALESEDLESLYLEFVVSPAKEVA